MKMLSSMRMQCSVLVVATTILASCASDAEKTNTAENTLTTNVVSSTTSVTNTPSKPIVRIEPAKVATSPGLQEIIQLCQAEVDESVILAYIERSPIAYNPSVEEILYLNDIGIPSQVVAALLKHGRELTEQQAAENANQTQAPATPTLEDTNAPAATAPNGSVVGTPNAISNAAPETPIFQYTPSAPPVVPETQVVTTTDTAPPQQQVTLNYFYSSLSPYGTWMQVDDYGWCWQPTVVYTYPNWQPYCDRGRWLYSDCGWYWQSDYSWGWAPFHYGRWLRHGGYGWVWCPDTVWGASWVSWRWSSGYCGWAPLPPGAFWDAGYGWRYRGRHVGVGFDFGLGFDCYTFISLGHFYDHNPYSHFVSRDHRRSIYGQTTVDNNYRRGPGGRVINEGIGRDRISAATHSQIHEVAVRDMPPSSTHAIRPDRTERKGGNVVIYRPNPQQPPTAMPAIAAKRIENNRPPVSIANPGSSHPIASPRLAEMQASTFKPTLNRTATAPTTIAPRAVESPSFNRRETVATTPTPIVSPTPKTVEQRKLFSERTLSAPKTDLSPARTAPATTSKPIGVRSDPTPRMPVSNMRAPAWSAPASAPTLSAPMPTVRSQGSPNYAKPPEAVRSMDNFNRAPTPMSSPNPSQGIRFNSSTPQISPSPSPMPAVRSLPSPSIQRMETAPARQIERSPVRLSSPPASSGAPARSSFSSPSRSASPAPRPAMAPAPSSSGRGNQSTGKRP